MQSNILFSFVYAFALEFAFTHERISERWNERMDRTQCMCVCVEKLMDYSIPAARLPTNRTANQPSEQTAA